jgi:DNA-binding PadR family transcriptional regulator
MVGALIHDIRLTRNVSMPKMCAELVAGVPLLSRIESAERIFPLHWYVRCSVVLAVRFSTVLRAAEDDQTGAMTLYRWRQTIKPLTLNDTLTRMTPVLARSVEQPIFATGIAEEAQVSWDNVRPLLVKLRRIGWLVDVTDDDGTHDRRNYYQLTPHGLTASREIATATKHIHEIATAIIEHDAPEQIDPAAQAILDAEAEDLRAQQEE